MALIGSVDGSPRPAPNRHNTYASTADLCLESPIQVLRDLNQSYQIDIYLEDTATRPFIIVATVTATPHLPSLRQLFTTLQSNSISARSTVLKLELGPSPCFGCGFGLCPRSPRTLPLSLPNLLGIDHTTCSVQADRSQDPGPQRTPPSASSQSTARGYPRPHTRGSFQRLATQKVPARTPTRARRCRDSPTASQMLERKRCPLLPQSLTESWSSQRF